MGAETDILQLVIIFLLINIVLLVVISGIFLYFYKSKTQRIMSHASLALSLLLKEKEEKVLFEGQDKEMAEFYRILEGIQKDLHQRENKLNEILRFVNSVAVNKELSVLMDDLLPKFLEVTHSTCSAFYLANHATGKLEIKASLGFSKNIYSQFDMSIGEGVIGIAAMNQEISIIKNIPDDSVYIMRTILGKIKPKNIMVVPVSNQGQLLGILVLASLYEYTEEQSDVIDMIKYYVGIAVGNGLTYEKNRRLTNELTFQNKLIQDLNEELEQKVVSRTVFLNNIIDSIQDYAIYAMDKNGIILAWNKGAESLIGYKKEEMMGKHFSVIYPEESKEIKSNIERAEKYGRYESSGWRSKVDGSSYYYETIFFPMQDDMGKNIGFTNVTRDITHVKTVEWALGYEKEFTRKMFESSSQALLIIDQNGTIEMANPQALVVLGVSVQNGDDVCELFMDSEYLRRNLVDVAQRYGRSKWAVLTKEGRTKIWFHVNVLVEEVGKSAKLIVNLSQ